MDTSQVLTAQMILDTLNTHIQELQAMGVVKIGLFGSHRRGEAKPDSDIDILVTLSEHTFDTYITLKLYLEDLFRHEVDLVLEEALKPRLRPYILNEVIYAQGS